MTRYRKAGRMFLVGWRSVVSGFQRVEEKQRERKKKKGGKKFRTGRKAGERGQGREKWLGSFACAIYLSKFTTRNVTLEPRVILDYRYKGFFTFQATLDSTVHEVKSRNFCKGKHVVVGRFDFHLFKVFCKSHGIIDSSSERRWEWKFEKKHGIQWKLDRSIIIASGSRNFLPEHGQSVIGTTISNNILFPAFCPVTQR